MHERTLHCQLAARRVDKVSFEIVPHLCGWRELIKRSGTSEYRGDVSLSLQDWASRS
jgi:hypothetical protein